MRLTRQVMMLGTILPINFATCRKLAFVATTPHLASFPRRCVRVLTMASNKDIEADTTRITSNPIAVDWEGGNATAAPRSRSAAPQGMSTRARVLIAVLVLTNLAAIAVAVVYVVKDSQSKTPAPRASTQALFYAGHADAAVAPGQSALSSDRSSTHFRRTVLSYEGTSREGKTVAAGVNRILHHETNEPVYDVQTELVNDCALGEYAGANGRVGDRTLRLRIKELATGVEVILIPHSLSLTGNVSLIPNHYFFSYKAPGADAVTSYASTVVKGRVVMFNDIGGAEWTSFMPKFFSHYEASWTADHPGWSASGRRLGFGSWAAGKVGGFIGGEFGGDAGRDIGSTAAKSMYGGESAGGAIGGAIGGHFGEEAGEAVGEDVGAAAGGALGTAIGGPVGGMIGEEVGGWAGRKLGGDVGQDIGNDIGTHLGDRVENDVHSWF